MTAGLAGAVVGSPMVGMSRTMSTPGVSTGTMNIELPWYGWTSGLVTAMTMRKSATERVGREPLVAVDDPLVAVAHRRVASSVGSAPAPGSVIENALRSLPSSRGCIHRSFCSSVPPTASSSALPESGALLPKIDGRVDRSARGSRA